MKNKLLLIVILVGSLIGCHEKEKPQTVTLDECHTLGGMSIGSVQLKGEIVTMTGMCAFPDGRRVLIDGGDKQWEGR